MDIVFINHISCSLFISCTLFMSCYISCWLFIYHAHYFYIMHVIHHRKKVRKTITENKRKLLGFLSGNIINPNKTTFNVFVPKFGYFTTVGFVKAISHDDLHSDFFWSEKIIWGVTSPLLNPAFFSSFTQFWECNCFPRCTNAFFRLGSFGGVASGLACLLLSKWASH